MKKIMILTIGLFLALSCSEKDSVEITNQLQESQKILSIDEINNYIENQLKQYGDVDWTNAPANILYSAVIHGGEVLTVGFGEQGQSFVQGKRSAQLNEVRNNIHDIVLKSEGMAKSNMIVSDDDIFNITDIRITKLETIKALQTTDGIRYLEPNGYSFYLKQEIQQKSAGCNQEDESIHNEDFRLISPNARLPWNFDIHKVPQAWNYSTGEGITIGLIDTGISASQNLLDAGFNDGDSRGRSVERFGTYIDSPWWWSNNIDGPNDKCGHGTQMASVIASPRNDDFMSVGVAYNANLIAYRATSDVVLNDYHERKGVSNALKALANRNDVKIISMSIGYPWSIGNVKDAVRYAYRKGKMIIAAGGTSTTFTNWYGVIFPASMSETIAVTGLKDNGYNRCNICHDGKKIDFTIVMQRAGDADRTIPVLGLNTGSQTYAGGSSIATATTAGIAALVWSRNPDMSRDQVLNKLKKAGEFYPNKNNAFGYGNINALKAVK
ncbi:S8/S53 family peptidase [Aquimarina sp. RZ0]|uniref:S8 family peptidase n=1 Tax=Aquimarina sp. RZ0 TaxID=2607730 RepID=UPI0011F0D68A|nr:S8/S53 family peptidase [Aquimarina sp. RZ0]KAA1247148.1 S8/S53 family peptidase [Aquimarina sp. RZ0]